MDQEGASRGCSGWNMLKVTIKHYFDFGGMSQTVNGHMHNAQAWDVLRLESAPSNIFAIPGERQEWLKRCHQERFVEEQAGGIADIIRGRFTRVNSYGTGPGFLEFFIKQECPDIFLQCSDYTVKSMERLRRVFTEADEIVAFDMLNGPWQNTGKSTLHLLYRVDTVLDNDQWRSVFEKMSSARIGYVLFFPCEFLTPRRWLKQIIKHRLWPLLGKRLAFAGYLRTKAQFLDMFSGVYTVEREVELAGRMRGFLLTVNS